MRISHQEARQKAHHIVSQMSLDEKIAQLNYEAPGIERLGIPPYNYWNEALHGVARAGVATVFPQAIGMAASFDEHTLQHVGEIIATEGRAKHNAYSAHGDRDIYKGLTFWSPNVNIFRDPRWGRGQETYGEDPYLTSRLGIAFINGLQGDGKYLKLAATAKHFAVHSGPEATRHEFDAQVGAQELERTYLPAFKAAIEEADVETVMTAYNSINGQPASVNENLLVDHLYKKWNFQGHVVSDFMALEDVHENHHYTVDAAHTMAESLKAGLDLCAGHCSDATKKAIEQGILSEQTVTEAVEALYATRVRLGMFDESCEYNTIAYTENNTAAHRHYARETAHRTFVLLKNDGTLPLDKQTLKSIAVIGPNADSTLAILGNYFGTPTHKTTVLEGIEQAVGEDITVQYSIGCTLFSSDDGWWNENNHRLSEAVIAAENSDVVVAVLGLDSSIEGEQGDAGNSMGAGDKADLNLPGHQQELLAKLLEVGKPVVVLLASGSSLSLNGLEDHPNLAALMQIWYPGGQGGAAVADVLFGDAAPSGKLPVTFYRNVEHLPEFTDYEMGNRTYKFIDYEPLYPFGYGLTYSTTKLESAELVENDTSHQTVSTRVQISNTGTRDEEQVVQLYVKNTDSPYAVRNWNLAGFKRVVLPAGSTQTVEITADPHALLVFDNDGNEIPDGKHFELYLGISQPDNRSTELLGMKPLRLTMSR